MDHITINGKTLDQEQAKCLRGIIEVQVEAQANAERLGVTHPAYNSDIQNLVRARVRELAAMLEPLDDHTLPLFGKH